MKISKPALAGAAAALAAALAWWLPGSAQLPVVAASAATAPHAALPGLRMTLEALAPGPSTTVATAVATAAAAATTVATAGSSAAAADDEASRSAARGVVRAVREATLSSRLAARIAEMPLAEGAAFKQGDVLVGFDCERQAAELRAAAALVEVQRKNVETNVELDKFESIGKNDLSISRSQLDKARAESDVLKSQLKDCRIVAPFPGRVIERSAHLYEAVAVSQPLLRVVDTSSLELDLIVPSVWLQWLGEGSEFQFRIDETGQTVAGTVTRLSPTVDPVSKTVKVIGRFKPGKGASHVLPGMSGSAAFRARG